MTQIVFLLFENSRAPKDSKDHYKVEIRFSPGAKGREEIIASGGSASSLEMDYGIASVPLKMIPAESTLKDVTRRTSSSTLFSTKPAQPFPSLVSQDQTQNMNQIPLNDEENNKYQISQASKNTVASVNASKITAPIEEQGM